MTTAFRYDARYLQAWRKAAADRTAGEPFMPRVPIELVFQYGRPKCGRCWDTGFCVECLGQYPQYCPVACDDGTCDCAAGRARRAAYARSLE